MILLSTTALYVSTPHSHVLNVSYERKTQAPPIILSHLANNRYLINLSYINVWYYKKIWLAYYFGPSSSFTFQFDPFNLLHAKLILYLLIHNIYILNRQLCIPGLLTRRMPYQWPLDISMNKVDS